MWKLRPLFRPDTLITVLLTCSFLSMVRVLWDRFTFVAAAMTTVIGCVVNTRRTVDSLVRLYYSYVRIVHCTKKILIYYVRTIRTLVSYIVHVLRYVRIIRTFVLFVRSYHILYMYYVSLFIHTFISYVCT